MKVIYQTTVNPVRQKAQEIVKQSYVHRRQRHAQED